MGQQRLGQIDELDGLFGHIFRAFAAHCLDGRINRGAESNALGGMNHFIHRHNLLLSFSLRLNIPHFMPFSARMYIDKNRVMFN